MEELPDRRRRIADGDGSSVCFDSLASEPLSAHHHVPCPAMPSVVRPPFPFQGHSLSIHGPWAKPSRTRILRKAGNGRRHRRPGDPPPINIQDIPESLSKVGPYDTTSQCLAPTPSYNVTKPRVSPRPPPSPVIPYAFCTEGAPACPLRRHNIPTTITSSSLAFPSLDLRLYLPLLPLPGGIVRYKQDDVDTVHFPSFSTPRFPLHTDPVSTRTGYRRRSSTYRRNHAGLKLFYVTDVLLSLHPSPIVLRGTPPLQRDHRPSLILFPNPVLQRSAAPKYHERLSSRPLNLPVYACRRILFILLGRFYIIRVPPSESQGSATIRQSGEPVSKCIFCSSKREEPLWGRHSQQSVQAIDASQYPASPPPSTLHGARKALYRRLQICVGV
ncbi:hypothetical protein NMY22_g12890 [Coprinellus aureogranulatus]|nr:hypothetical protein NMY22_g12890 [Coprinellus aureogranulatus]